MNDEGTIDKGSYCLEVDRRKQVIRVFDVLVIAPILIYAGYKLGAKSWLGIALIIIGAGTAVYNGMNLVRSKMNRNV
jgi:small basic protein